MITSPANSPSYWLAAIGLNYNSRFVEKIEFKFKIIIKKIARCVSEDLKETIIFCSIFEKEKVFF